MAVEDIAGNRCRRSFLLPVHTGHIACMGCGGHCMFQGIFQVPVQNSLPCCCGDIAAGYIGRIDSLIMGSRIMTMFSKSHTGLSDYRAALFMSPCQGLNNADIKVRKEYAGWQTRRNYRAKLATASCRTARSGLAVSAKIILAALRYFSRKPCLTGSGRCNALVVQRAAKPGYSIIKIK